MESSRIIKHQGVTNGYTPHQIHNSELAINRAAPDILYNIFKLAVSESSTPVQTVLNISHVCHYWRDTALGSPILWRFIDMDSPRSIVDLFLSRSGNTPLIMSWTQASWLCFSPPCFLLDKESSKVYRGSIANPNHVLPRLCSLTLYIRRFELPRIQHLLLQNPEAPPLQLRRLDILLGHPDSFGQPRDTSFKLTDFVRVDPSCLRELRLHGLDLPLTWLEFPPGGGLTHFKFACPKDPPALSHLVRFLSSCPLLCDLELRFYAVDPDKIDIADPMIKSIKRLDFPKLKRFMAGPTDGRGYVYIRELVALIKPVTSLSELFLDYNIHENVQENGRMIPYTTPRNIFEAIPSGALSNFTGHRYLHIRVGSGYGADFEISSAPDNSPPFPLYISGSGSHSLNAVEGSSLFGHLAPILDTIRTMPDITQLELSRFAWKLPWVTDIPNLFPCLNTLGLDVWEGPGDHDFTLALPAGLKLKKLILLNAQIISVEVLLNVISKAGVELVELKTRSDEQDQNEVLETALRRKGVAVIRSRGFLGSYMTSYLNY